MAQPMLVLRAPDGPADWLDAPQVKDYLNLLNAKDAEVLKGAAFEERAKQLGGAALSSADLAAAVEKSLLGDLPKLSAALKDEFANGGLRHAIEAFGRTQNGSSGISGQELPEFVRFCVAYRIHCYFETSRLPVNGGANGVKEVTNGIQNGVVGPKVVFVLGGPGAGKGTQCQRLSETYGYIHLSAGDLLREEVKRPGSQFGDLISSYQKEGKLVPVEITVKLLKQAMEQHGWDKGKFLIDGFPRSFDNMQGWNEVLGGKVQVKCALFFDCSEACMQARLLERGKTSGRADDNMATIQKRFKTFQNDSMPVANVLDQQALLKRISAEKPLEEVWQKVRSIFGPTVIFVHGGPGAGKKTQCKRIAEAFGYKWLSVDTLAEQETKKLNSEFSGKIEQAQKEGKAFPPEVSVELVLKAMRLHCWEGGRYVIDGMPRGKDELKYWENKVGEEAVVKTSIYLECHEGCMEARLLAKGDKIDSIRQRFRGFYQESMPVVEHFEADGRLHRIDAEKDEDEVFKCLQTIFGPRVVFVLGGPGSGKGTQCAKIADMFGYVHLSAGDLIREERKRPGSEYGELIESYIKEGKILPSEITVNLIKNAMVANGWEGGKYLIDGFPRNFENLEGWNNVLGGKVTVSFTIFFDCSEDVMEARLLERGKTSGRSDDNIESIKKRFRVFQGDSKPVIDKFAAEGALRRIDAKQSPDAVWQDVQRLFGPSVVFVLGGPGAGKGTVCSRMARSGNFQHLDAGQLLREETLRNKSEVGAQIKKHMQDATLVPGEVTVQVIKKAMETRGWEGGRYVISSFPLSLENYETWQRLMANKTWTRLAISLECSTAVGEARCLEREKMRVDREGDSEALIKKQIAQYAQDSPPILQKFAADAVLRRIDAEQDIEQVWSCTTDVLGMELDNHVVNQAIVFVKPHAQNQETDRFVQSYLTAHKVAVLKKGTMPQRELVSTGFFEKQYFQIWEYAQADPSALQVSPAGQERFRQAFGESWTDALARGGVCNAVNAPAKLSLSEAEIEAQWAKGNRVDLAPSLVVAKIEGKGASAIVVNGYAPNMKSNFVKAGQSLTWFAVEFSPSNVTWAHFRQQLLGSTDPSQAPKDSIRGQMYEHWEALGLREQPGLQNNCVHASAGPIEALRERLLLTEGNILEETTSRLLLSSGIPVDTVRDWLRNPEVFGWKVGHEMRSGPVFDCTNAVDTVELRDAAVHHFLSQGGKQMDFWKVVARKPGQKQTAETAAAIDTTKKPNEKRADKMTILHFNDVYNVEPRQKEPVGGIARFVTRVRELKAAAVERGEPEAVVLFSGDAFNPSLTSTTTMGRHMIPALNAIGIHTACYGNHDFDFGVDNLRQMAAQNNFPWLMSNVTDKASGRPLADGIISRMMDFHGRKVGIIGLVEKEWLVTLATLNPEDVIFEDFCRCGRRLAKQLKEKQGAEIVIAITHMRVPNDELLAHEVSEIDIILGGHDHHYDVKPVGPHGTYVLTSGTDFRDITVLTLDFEQKEGNKCFKVIRTDHEEITAKITEDATMKTFVDECMSKLGAAMDKVIGESAVDLDSRFSMIRTQETNCGNFIADVMRLGIKADIAIINSGTLRADAIIEAGPIKMRDLVNLLPMLDELCLLQLSGAQVTKVLENSVSQYPRLEGRFAQVSGVTFSFDASKPGGERVLRDTVKVAGKPLENDKLYKIVTKDYLRQGKDGFDVFKDAACLADGEQAGILPSMVRETFKEISCLNGFTTDALSHATERAAKLLQDGFVSRVGDGPEVLKRFMINPKIEGRIVCLNPAT
eukprot:TRINITY_DN81924_c0_g1_i1.p1 TRINITY_DN81924_c0_g1~~TRINITY_DN81924_c0_g1_i1.p1  ORF type:complete len:1781 (+),score=505.68 TRINITY_DN81924_c0_g1_i1:112-5454(+)